MNDYSLVKEIIEQLDENLKISKRSVLSFEEFLEKVRSNPLRLLRNIFQIFADFIQESVGPGVEEYPDDPESIGFVKYDMSSLLVDGMDQPFFADRLFANRFVRLVEQMRTGAAQQNKIFIFEGPHGCGKSIFLNNLLSRFEEYTNQPKGETFEIVWRLDQSQGCSDSGEETKILEITCPSHDNPLLIIPKNKRRDLVEQILSGSNPETKERILKSKEYEWLWKDSCCPICRAIFCALLDKFESFEQVQRAIFARTVKFDRVLGDGISVFSPGDAPSKQVILTDKGLQERLDAFFGSSNAVKYLFSRFAKTNCGVYALMDIRGENTGRFSELHGIVSEGYHKVDECVEEGVKSLFFVVANPGDIVVGAESVKEESSDSVKQRKRGLVIDHAFTDRLQYFDMSYITEVKAEVNTYASTFGQDIKKAFLPGVLDNFARVIISSRLIQESWALKSWIKDFSKYEKYCDKDGLLLKMAIYSGVKPAWLSDEDVKRFTKKIRGDLILKEGAKEGKNGISGRDALDFFGDLYSARAKLGRLITMIHVDRFFRDLFKKKAELKSIIPMDFLKSLTMWYNYTVVQQIKESLYDYNEERIRRDVIHYIFASSQDSGVQVSCPYTKETVEVTEDFLKIVEDRIWGSEELDEDLRKKFREDTMQKFARLLSQEGKNLDIQKTELFKDIYGSYVVRLKEGALDPFLKNESFKEAIKVYGTEVFKTFDTRIKESVSLMVGKLCKLYGYTEQGAKEVCIYALDNDIVDQFSG
jgi:predicted Ser/Thr protein kinase